MATYSELAGLQSESGFNDFREKVAVACVIKAQSLLDLSTPTANQVDWAKATLSRPANAADSVLWYIVAANSSATVAQILAATDNAIQTNINSAVDAITGV